MHVLARKLLLPLSALYWLATYARNKKFDSGRTPSVTFPVPVIAVGNITVGGTGKTPHIEYLLRILLNSGLRVASLSRGYKRKTTGFVLYEPGISAKEFGDEPLQIAQKFPNAEVAVCEKRVSGIEQLLARDPALQCIVLDDAYQHRYVTPSLNILLVDYNRPVWDDYVFPAGMMREGLYATGRADVVIISKCPVDMAQERTKEFRERLNLKEGQKLFCSSVQYQQPVDLRSKKRTASAFNSAFVLTGIAKHGAFVRYVEAMSILAGERHFPDHHLFSDEELRAVFQKAEGCNASIVTTEKDAMRIANSKVLNEFPAVPVFYIPIMPQILFGQQELFNSLVLGHITIFEA